jgi:NADH-quinone oxidoreductase subunit L
MSEYAALAPWAWAFTLPGLLVTALGPGRRPWVASVPGPLLVLVAGLSWLLGPRAVLEAKVAGWLPFISDGAYHTRVDALSASMLCVVGAVSACVYVYSLAYMAEDPAQRRYFAFLDLFVATMTWLVLAGNLVMLLVGWAGVGLSSFLLITFWYDRPGSLAAGMKALAANAVGDAALLLAIVLVPAGHGDLTALAAPGAVAGYGGAALLAGLIVLAASAKSAQGLLYFWLPSAMAGPTPVSALMHAATMVAAGVYLLVRTFPVLELDPRVLDATAWLGVTTAVFAALASLRQENFKRGLAYSTVSQLGYMFAAIGFAAPFAAYFHLVTHAFFKALLFLSAGVAIHAVHGEERLEKLGGLRKAVPGAALGFLVGSLALVGLPVVTSGAFSKDLILEAGLARSPLLGSVLLGSVFLSGLYSGRLYFGVFEGESRHSEVHHPSPLMLGALLPLAAGALGLGYLEYPSGAFSQLLGLTSVAAPEQPAVHLVSGTGALAAGLGLAGLFAALLWQQKSGWLARLRVPSLDWEEGTGSAIEGASEQVGALHSGRLNMYLFVFIIGAALLLLLVRNLA